MSGSFIAGPPREAEQGGNEGDFPLSRFLPRSGKQNIVIASRASRGVAIND